MKNYGFALLAACLSVLVMPAHADKMPTLIGSTVIGTLVVDGSPTFTNNSFDTTTIASGTEFSATTTTETGTATKGKSFAYSNTFTAKFDGMFDIDNETCEDENPGNPPGTVQGCGLVNNPNAYPGFTMTFTDTVFEDAIFSVVLDPTGYTFTPPTPGSDTFTVTYAGGANPAGNFKVNIVPTPEPGGLVLLGTGLIGVVAAGRRRLFS